MVGRGDFRGFHAKDPNSRFRKLISRIKAGKLSDPVMKGKIINATGGRCARFCCDTGCSANIMPAKMAAGGGLKWRELDPDEPAYKSVTNEQLEIVGQTSAWVKLEKLKTPIRLNFLVCLDEGDEALLSLDTLKELSIVPWNFPTPMDRHKREHKARRVVREYDSGYEEEEEWQEQKDREEEKEEGIKQEDRQVQERELFTLQVRVGSLRSKI